MTAVKYMAASAISVVVTEIALFILFGVVRLGPTSANVLATAIAAVPSYYLNRNWAWGKSGRSHFMKEVVPFWSLAFLGLALSIVTVNVAHDFAVQEGFSHLLDTLAVNAASITAFGIVWIGKFFIFNKYLFASPLVSSQEILPDA